MRTMPRMIHANPCAAHYDPSLIAIPTLPHDEWNARLAEIAGRPLTADEQARADQMASHNWTLCVVAEELFGSP